MLSQCYRELAICLVNINAPKTKNIYVPLALIGLSVVLILVEVSFISNNASSGALERLAAVALKTILYVFILLLGIGLCSWFSYPFDPFYWSLLQLFAVTLSVGAVRSTLGIVTGDSVAMITCCVLFLGLIGYFFSDEPMNALIAIFLIFATHSVVTSLLMPLFAMFFA